MTFPSILLPVEHVIDNLQKDAYLLDALARLEQARLAPKVLQNYLCCIAAPREPIDAKRAMHLLT